MAEADPKFDPKLEEGVAYFERMLQVMPDDRTTLEFLCVAYRQLGREQDRRRALVMLARTLVKEGDLASAQAIAEHLKPFDDPDARAIVLKIGALAAPAPDLTPEKVPVREEDELAAAVAAGVAAETALLDALEARRAVSEESARAVRAHLEGLGARPNAFLVSTLAILARENPAEAEAVCAYVADRSGCPPIPLDAFDVTAGLAGKLPAWAVRVRGAIPFAELGKTLLVAVPNPLDEALLAELGRAAGRPCRFFLAPPRELEELLEKLAPAFERTAGAGNGTTGT